MFVEMIPKWAIYFFRKPQSYILKFLLHISILKYYFVFFYVCNTISITSVQKIIYTVFNILFHYIISFLRKQSINFYLNHILNDNYIYNFFIITEQMRILTESIFTMLIVSIFLTFYTICITYLSTYTNVLKFIL